MWNAHRHTRGKGRQRVFLRQGDGAIEAVVALCSISMTLVEPRSGSVVHLKGEDKEAARQRALQLFPTQHALLARKKDHGRADAALLVVASLECVP